LCVCGGCGFVSVCVCVWVACVCVRLLKKNTLVNTKRV